MTTNAAVARKTVLDLFTEVTAAVDWGTIDDLYETVITNDDLVGALLTGDIRAAAIKRGIRQLIKRVPNEHGHAAFASVKHTDAEGKVVTLYKQETLFNVEDYRYCANSHIALAKHHQFEAFYYSRRCEERFSEQIVLPFELPD